LTILCRSRSRSPSESSSKTRLPEELKKHLEFELVETDGMTEEQLREIPYTAVKTSLKTNNSSPPLSSKRKTYSSRRAKRSVYKTVPTWRIHIISHNVLLFGFITIELINLLTFTLQQWKQYIAIYGYIYIMFYLENKTNLLYSIKAYNILLVK